MENILYRDAMTGIRVADNPISGVQRQEALLTTYVLTMGALEEEGPSPGYRLFPELDVPKYEFSVPVMKGEELIPMETTRGYGGQIRTVRWSSEERTFRLVRHTLQGIVDDDETLNQTPPIDAGAKAASLARQILMKGLEVKKAALVANDANFGLVINVTSGNGWNEETAPESMREDVDAACSYLEDTLGISRSNFRMALFGKARNAARNNIELRSTKSRGGNVALPDFAEVADFLDIKEVWGAITVKKESVAAAVEPLYAPDAVVYYPGNPSRQASLKGDRAWGRSFTLGPGVALTPYRSEERTSTLYPWQKREKTFIVDPTAAVKIKNPYQV